MIERSDRIDLPLTEWRCSSDACGRARTCARRLAALPPGAPLGDGLRNGPACSSHITAAVHKTLERAAAPVKPYIRGL